MRVSAPRAERAARENGFAGWRAADVTEPDSLTEALADVPHVHHLVLLAGTFEAGNLLKDDIEHLRRPFDERIWAAVHTIRALGERLAADGSITFVSGSIADRPSANGMSLIAAAAAAMEAFARALALEMAPRRVNALSPGATDTPLLARTLGGGDGEAALTHLTSSLPLHRLGRPEEVGAAVVFLMSNGFMNGETLHVDGGSRLV